MKKKTIVFFPIEVGLAHVSRSLAIAEELHARGHRIIFTLPQRKQALFKKSPVTFVDIVTALNKESVLLLKNFQDIHYIRQLMKDEIRILDTYHPDAVVVDFRISALGAAAARRVKTYAIFQGSALPYGGFIPNPGINSLLYSPFRKTASILFAFSESKYLKPLLHVSGEFGNTMSLDTWFRSVTYILPEASFYLPTNDTKLDKHYIGEISWKGFNTMSPPWLANIKPDGRTVYLTFGGTGFDPHKLVELSETLTEKGYRVIVTTGTICNPEDLPPRNNLFVAKFLPGAEVSKHVDIVVCHGGYGTMLQAIYAGKPVISIPFNPDQIVHGWRFQELGMGKCALGLNLHTITKLLSFDFGIFEKLGQSIQASSVVTLVDQVMHDYTRYTAHIAEFTKKYPYSDGAKEAADIIEQ